MASAACGTCLAPLKTGRTSKQRASCTGWGAQLALLGATLLVPTEGDVDENSRYPELAVSDVIIGLRHVFRGARLRRPVPRASDVAVILIVDDEAPLREILELARCLHRQAV